MKIATVIAQIKDQYARTLQLPLLVRPSAYSFCFVLALDLSLSCEVELQCLTTVFFYLSTHGMPSLAFSLPSSLIWPNATPSGSPSPTLSVLVPSFCTLQVIMGSCKIILILSETSRHLYMCLSADIITPGSFSISTYILEMSSGIFFKTPSFSLV